MHEQYQLKRSAMSADRETNCWCKLVGRLSACGIQPRCRIPEMLSVSRLTKAPSNLTFRTFPISSFARSSTMRTLSLSLFLFSISHRCTKNCIPSALVSSN